MPRVRRAELARQERPRTLKEARRYRYGVWAGNLDGDEYDPARCAYEARYKSIRGLRGQQCSRVLLAPPGYLYCLQHARIMGRRESPNPK